MNWKAEFGSVKKATDLVLSDLRNLTNGGDWEELMEQAKAYDQSIRKGSVKPVAFGWRWWMESGVSGGWGGVGMSRRGCSRLCGAVAATAFVV